MVITTHHKPDADALGSSLGLYLFLEKMGIEAQVISPTDYGDFLKWMPGETNIINYELNESLAIEMTNQAEIIFCLDFNSLKRINQYGKHVQAAQAKKVMIDHHLEPESFADYALHSTLASSASELVFLFIEMMGMVDVIDENIASCIYAGILTDTASFRHSSTQPSTHRVAAVLLEKGAKPNKINEAIYDNFSANRTRFMGYCLNEKLQILDEYHTALMCITADELKRYEIITGDTEGLVNWGLSIQGIRFSVLIVDRTVLRKMSFRSKDNFPANEFARTYFNGGGHFNAAGGESSTSLEETETRFKLALKDYRHYLT